MKTLDIFIREAGRLYPPVIHVPRGVVADFEFGGYAVPGGHARAPGARRRPPAARCLRRPRPLRPRPLRAAARGGPPQPYSLVTFGGGPRICIGINFANIEVKALAAHVLRTYRLSAVPAQELAHAGHWTAFVPGGIRLRARPL